MGFFQGGVLRAKILAYGKAWHIGAGDGKRIKLRAVIEKVVEVQGVAGREVVVKAESELVGGVLQLLRRPVRIGTVVRLIGQGIEGQQILRNGTDGAGGELVKRERLRRR